MPVLGTAYNCMLVVLHVHRHDAVLTHVVHVGVLVGEPWRVHIRPLHQELDGPLVSDELGVQFGVGVHGLEGRDDILVDVDEVQVLINDDVLELGSGSCLALVGDHLALLGPELLEVDFVLLEGEGGVELAAEVLDDGLAEGGFEAFAFEGLQHQMNGMNYKVWTVAVAIGQFKFFCHNKMIIQSRQDHEEFAREQEEVVKEIEHFKRINASLKRKIQARDKKINNLLSHFEHLSKSTIQPSPELSAIRKNRSEVESKFMNKDIARTEVKHREKQNVSSINRSLFKDRTIEYCNIAQRPNLRLPTLRKNLFSEDPELSESRPRIVKVSIEKLVAIKPEDMKKKFEMKYRGLEA